jgi:uncharacterized membrane protein (UPF0127 family)
MKRLACALLGLFSASCAWAESMPKIELSIGMYRINAEVAATEEDRMLGLMYRTKMPPEHGMLFVFEQAATHCMWMKNTRLPLSVAFLDEAGRILNIEDMAPQTEDTHCAAKPARFALEMNQGWFKQKGLEVGRRIEGIERAPQPQ